MSFPVYSISNDFIDGVDESSLHSEILALNISFVDFLGVSVSGDDCQILFSDTPSLDDIVRIDGVVSTHNALEACKLNKISELEQQTNLFVVNETRYPIHKQITLSKLQQDAYRTGLNNRAAYIQQAWDWVFTVMNYYYYYEAQVKAANTRAEVDALVMNLDSYVSTDPKVSIYQTMGILD